MSTIKVDTIQNTSGVEQYMAKAWVNFDGASNSISGSGNVSSLTDNATGRHSINFSNAFASASYGAGLSFEQPNFSSNNGSLGKDVNIVPTTISYPVFGQGSDGIDRDWPYSGGLFMA